MLPVFYKKTILQLISDHSGLLTTPPRKWLNSAVEMPRSGEITLAHRGILFLDEFPEFHRDTLESLHQPMEEGKITVLRSKHFLTLPARFTIIAASNPCPCGYRNDPERECKCSNSQIAMYQRKLSGPLMDRFDLFIEVPAVKYEKLANEDRKNLPLRPEKE